MERKIDEYQIPRGATLDVCITNDSAYDAGVKSLTSNGYTAGTARQLAEARVLADPNAPVSKRWAWVAEGVVYALRAERVIFVPKALNPVLKYAGEATKAHREGREFTITDEHLERIISDKGVLNMSRQDADKLAKSGLPTGSFGEDALTDFLGWGKDYGKLLSDYGIKAVPLYLVDAGHARKQEQAFSRGLWVNCLDSNSAIGGGYVPSGCVFGVRERSEPRRAEHADAPSGATRAVSSGSAGLVAPTLEQVLAVAGRFTADVNRDALQKELAGLYRK